jgi:Sulfatase
MNIKMLILRYARAALLGAVLLSVTTASAFAQQITGVPGSPTATITPDGRQLPPAPLKFGGVIKESAKDSTPGWPPRVVPPKGAPKVLLIMTDDQGYGVPGTFGGVIPTPALDRIAKAGLRYTQFHSTALCSPTRAALITERNHHSVGYGVIGELSTGYPGYDSVIGPENATVAEILKENGYATSWFGKDQNVPGFQYSTTAGPFKEVARKTIPHTIPLLMSIDETFDVGIDTRTPVDFAYDVPFRFTGKIDKLTFNLGPEQLSAEEKKAAAKAIAVAKD